MRHGVWGVVTPKTLPRADGPPLSALRTASAKCTLVLPSRSRARLSQGGAPRAPHPPSAGNRLEASYPAREPTDVKSLGPRQARRAGDEWRRLTPRRPPRGPRRPGVCSAPGAAHLRGAAVGRMRLHQPGAAGAGRDRSSLSRQRRGARRVRVPVLADSVVRRSVVENASARGAAHADGGAEDTLAGSSDPVSKRPARRLGAAAGAVSSRPERADGRAVASAGLAAGSAATSSIALRARRQRPWGGGAGAGGAPRTPLRTCPS